LPPIVPENEVEKNSIKRDPEKLCTDVDHDHVEEGIVQAVDQQEKMGVQVI
jgi:hypothetical protein